MIPLATVINTFAERFRAQYRNRLGPEHHRALNALPRCRTHASRKMLLHCTACPQQVLVPHSCGHRHCPHCQHYETEQWLQRQLRKQLPTEYFLITFTLPAELRPLCRTHPRVLYDLLLRCSWDTLHTFSRNDKQLHGTPGAIAVLHTHNRRLDFHPHAHLVMPAAAVNAERTHWRTKRPVQAERVYLFNARALAKVFRAKVLDALTAAKLPLPTRRPKRWVVHCKSVGSGTKALGYLARYLYRGVISEHDILACTDTTVTFRYRDAKSSTLQRRTLPGPEFLWLILQHVLPKGFRRCREFGFLHPNCKRLIAVVHLALHFEPTSAAVSVTPRPPILCAGCGAVMTIVKTQIRTSQTRPAPTVPLVEEAA